MISGYWIVDCRSMYPQNSEVCHKIKRITKNLEFKFNFKNMHAIAGAVRPGGPRVKGTETVYCTHCFKNGSDRETAKSVKRNLPRHNKRCHSELDPVKDQTWLGRSYVDHPSSLFF